MAALRIIPLVGLLAACGDRPPEPVTRPVTIQPPEHMANVWWAWPQADRDRAFTELDIHFTVHNDPGDFSDDHGLYFMLCYGTISDVAFYFGIQTDVAPGRGKGVILSRWGTRDLALTDVAGLGDAAWVQSSGHEGDFIGVRCEYPWGAGPFRARLVVFPDQDPDGAWVGVMMRHKSVGEDRWMGSVKFPYKDGEVKIQPSIYSTVEIYGNIPIRISDIPRWHVSVERPLLDGVMAASFTSSYSPFTDGAVTNANVRYDRRAGALHFEVGGTTMRTDPPQSRTFD